MYDPEQDGISHLNVYSKGKTELGRYLSNFANSPFQHNGCWFMSVEAGWFVYKLQKVAKNYPNDVDYINDLYSLTKLYGFKAKFEGRRLLEKWSAENVADIPKKVLKQLYLKKLEYNPEILSLLLENELPLVHYYVAKGNFVDASKYNWTVDLWSEIKQEKVNGTMVNTLG